jgi:Uma2 family endonuclease
MVYPAKHFTTPEEYLTLEELAETKHEYFNGQIYDLAGVSRNHNLITLNIASTLMDRVRDRPCEVYSTDMRLLVKPNGLYTYPNVMVVCGTPEFIHRQTDTLLNPTLIVEVLSPSTAVYDRGHKFELYKALPSLRDYLLVEQDRVAVEYFQRARGSRKWSGQTFAELKQAVSLRGVGCELPLREIYRKVELSG